MIDRYLTIDPARTGEDSTLFTYSNRYGRLTLRLVTEVGPVRGIHSRDVAPENMFQGMEIAEQVALITDNRRLQIAFASPLTEQRGFVIVHDSPSTAAVARIESIEYTGPNPQAEIHSHARRALI